MDEPLNESKLHQLDRRVTQFYLLDVIYLENDVIDSETVN